MAQKRKYEEDSNESKEDRKKQTVTTIRPATTHDLWLIIDYLQKQALPHVKTNNASRTFWERIPDLMYNRHFLFVALKAEELVGYIMHNQLDEIVCLEVHPDHRLENIGRNLVAEAEKSLLSIAAKNTLFKISDTAEGFWLKQGYEVHSYFASKSFVPADCSLIVSSVLSMQ